MTDYGDKNILAIDTSTQHLKLGLAFGGDRLVTSDEFIEKDHGRFIFKKITELFQSAGLNRECLDAIVVSTGPGSFTGLRVGLAAAKGMAIALDVAVVGVNLFEIAAFKLRNYPERVNIVVPLRKEEFLVTVVHQGKYSLDDVEIISDKRFSSVLEDHPVAAMGFDFNERFPALGNPVVSDLIEYDAGELIRLGREKLSAGNFGDLAALEPLYFQKPQAEVSLERRRRK